MYAERHEKAGNFQLNATIVYMMAPLSPRDQTGVVGGGGDVLSSK